MIILISSFSIGTMGGGEHAHGEAHGDFRAKVWSMSGGPYCRPKHWKRNTAIAMAGIVLVCIPIAMKSAELEVSLCPFCLSIPFFFGLFKRMDFYMFLIVVLVGMNHGFILFPPPIDRRDGEIELEFTWIPP